MAAAFDDEHEPEAHVIALPSLATDDFFDDAQAACEREDAIDDAGIGGGGAAAASSTTTIPSDNNAPARDGEEVDEEAEDLGYTTEQIRVLKKHQIISDTRVDADTVRALWVGYSRNTEQYTHDTNSVLATTRCRDAERAMVDIFFQRVELTLWEEHGRGWEAKLSPEQLRTAIEDT